MFTYVAERKERQISVRIRTVFVLVNACKCAPSSSAVSGAPANRRRARSQPAPSASGSLAGRWRARRPASPNPRSRTPDASPPLSRLCDAEPASLTEGCWRRTRGACRVAQARAEASVLPGEVLKDSRGNRPAHEYSSARKKAAHEVRPKSREETPKEGSDRATPIAVSQCTIYAASHKNQARRRHTSPDFRTVMPESRAVWLRSHAGQDAAAGGGALSWRPARSRTGSG
jgi:hypothetical protein